jgi:heme/copper-type cytochrome/quinol oxidase subunit 3
MDWITTVMKVLFNQNIQWAGNVFLALEIFFFAAFFINFLKMKPYWPGWEHFCSPLGSYMKAGLQASGFSIALVRVCYVSHIALCA